MSTIVGAPITGYCLFSSTNCSSCPAGTQLKSGTRTGTYCGDCEIVPKDLYAYYASEPDNNGYTSKIFFKREQFKRAGLDTSTNIPAGFTTDQIFDSEPYYNNIAFVALYGNPSTIRMLRFYRYDISADKTTITLVPKALNGTDLYVESGVTGHRTLTIIRNSDGGIDSLEWNYSATGKVVLEKDTTFDVA